MTKKEAGIYEIRCRINNRVYIGQSRNLKDRISKHKRFLKDGVHENNALQNAWNKYGEENFTFIVLEHYDPTLSNIDDILNQKEKEYIKLYQCNQKQYGYNHTDGGQAFKMNEDVIRKGEQVSNVLTEQDVLDIREYIENDEHSPSELAIIYGVHIGTIHSIRRGVNWSYLTGGKRIGKEFNFNRGTDNSHAKLTDEDVKDIVMLLEMGVPMPEIAKQFNVIRDTIWDIRNGESWKHITGGKVNKKTIFPVGENTSSAKLTDEIVKSIVKKYKKGEKRSVLAKKYKIGISTLHALLAGGTWKHITGGVKVVREIQIGLSKENANLAVQMYKKGYTQRQIAKHLNVGNTTIHALLNGETWKEITGREKVIPPNRTVNGRRRGKQTSEEDALEIVRLFKEGWTGAAIAKRFDISLSHTYDIKHGKKCSQYTGIIYKKNV
ncbi:helix-turn-helix domain-containing protein [Bacillus sp. AFS088145]|uniref:helix-turn-helix domain-containing protein n=1 Tax=Bacillus sp. AFS088145 TaxID=2033514 RepID=UPI0011557873|nr:helix-turn-helix domain-containing protein [Bacillus sp. AFS088145]